MLNKAPRSITIPAGIGDAIWIWQKLCSTTEKFHVIIPDGMPQRGHQLCELLPNIISSWEYAPKLSYNRINENNAQAKKKQWSNIKDQSFFLSANAWLEKGIRLDSWLPDLPILYRIDYSTGDSAAKTAEEFLPAGHHYVGIYGSAYSNARNWNMWGHEEWFSLARMMYERNDYIKFVLIGATYDTDMADQLIAKFWEYKIPFVSTIGQPLSVVIEVLKRLSYFLGFPSGLSILNETLGKDTLMFYPRHLKLMMNTWADPERIANGAYKGCQLCPPEQLFDWLKNDYKLFEKLKA